MRADSQHTGSCQEESSEPPEADGVSVRSCAQASRKHSQGKQPYRMLGMATLWMSMCTTNTFVTGEGGRSVRDWASPQSL